MLLCNDYLILHLSVTNYDNDQTTTKIYANLSLNVYIRLYKCFQIIYVITLIRNYSFPTWLCRLLCNKYHLYQFLFSCFTLIFCSQWAHGCKAYFKLIHNKQHNKIYGFYISLSLCCLHLKWTWNLTNS